MPQRRGRAHRGCAFCRTRLLGKHCGGERLMRMDDQEESQNVEDVRGSSGGGFRPIHGIGLGTIAIALVGGWIFGVSPLQILSLRSGGTSSSVSTAPGEPAQT